MNKILAIDTSSEACSVALQADRIYFRHEIVPRQHNQLLVPMIETVLAEAGITVHDLNAIAIGCGPGSFVGVRLGLGVAQGLAFAAKLPLIPLSSLQILAQSAIASDADDVCITVDAHMGDFYRCHYKRTGDLMLPTEEAHVIKNDGTATISQNQYPNAIDALSLAVEEIHHNRTVPPDQVQPIYPRGTRQWKLADSS